MQKNQTIKISFMVLKSRTTQKGEVPLYCSLLLKSEKNRFSTGISIPPELWIKSKQKVKGNSLIAENANSKIIELIQKVKTIESQFIKTQEEYLLEDVVSILFNKNRLPFKTIMETFEYNINQMKELEGKEYKTTTIDKSVQMQKITKDFMQHFYKVNDMLLTKIDLKFLFEFEFYLKSNRNLSVAYINKIIQKLKAIMKIAFDYGIIQRPAFPNHKFKHENIKVVYLTIEELNKLEVISFVQERLNLVRDLFLFSVYTGLHYSDAMSLTKDNIIIGVDKKKWICYTRQKTDVEIQIPILEKTNQLMNKFSKKYELKENIIPRFSSQKINSYLKEMADIIGIKKNLSHKVARKTFGSVLLYYNVPMKVVSKLMGHSSVLITERHYAQVELKKLGYEMDKVNTFLSE